jgi:ligand-binding SRPBCC domain-containing protein
MKIFALKRTQTLPISLDEAWAFFSSPKNLALITPPRMNFRITAMSGGEQMHSGQIIGYRVTVLPFIRLRWETEITDVEKPTCFTDKQRLGPYTQWHHKHQFQQVPGGVLMTDEVEYAMPFGIIGRLLHMAFVRAEVNAIFDYRHRTLETYFRDPQE